MALRSVWLKERESGVVPTNETTSKAKTELIESIRLSEIEIGRILQEARKETAKISLEDAEASLRIKKDYLIALESGNFNLLPGTTYVSGFLKELYAISWIKHQSIPNAHRSVE